MPLLPASRCTGHTARRCTRAGRRGAAGVANMQVIMPLAMLGILATEQQVLVAETSGKWTTLAAVISAAAVVLAAIIPIVIFQRQRRKR